MKKAKFKKLLLSGTLLFSGCHLFTDNFGEVEPYIVFRSAQLDEEDLEARITENQILSVLNLRGEKPDKDWYQAEKETCDRLNVTLYNVRMSARRLPYRDTIESLLNVFETCKYPLLIHCKAGADRTGLASALYRIHMNYDRVENADDELSLCYGHISLPDLSVYAMDQFLILYEHSKAENLREFLKNYPVIRSQKK